jgi:hypothetical protein
MSLKYLHIASTLLASLLTATAFGHTLEMPMKLRVSAVQWLTFQHGLYAWYAIIGGPIEILTILFTAALAYKARQLRISAASRSAAILLVVAFLIWLGFTNPVNARTATWTPESIPADWQHWRMQWEYSHATRFALQFAALALLVHAAFKPGAEPRESIHNDHVCATQGRRNEAASQASNSELER